MEQHACNKSKPKQQEKNLWPTTNDQMMFVGICLLYFYYFSIFLILLSHSLTHSFVASSLARQ